MLLHGKKNLTMKASSSSRPLLCITRTTGHMNYWAALALRARVNLYLDDLNIGGTADHNALALKDAKKIIEEGPYSL